MEHRDELGRAGRHARPGDLVVRPLVLCLWLDAHPVSSGTLSFRYCARYSRQCGCAAAWAVIGVVHLADSRSHLSIRERILSTFDAPYLPPIFCKTLAAVICVRGHARDRLGR